MEHPNFCPSCGYDLRETVGTAAVPAPDNTGGNWIPKLNFVNTQYSFAPYTGGTKIEIDRSRPFDPASFIGKGWAIEEQDERSLALAEIDLTAVRFETMLKPKESSVDGETKLERLKAAGHIRLDAGVFEALWDNQSLIPESWKRDEGGNIRFIYFDGTVLRAPDDHRYVLFLYWLDGQWHWLYNWLEFDWYADGPSAVLASRLAA